MPYLNNTKFKEIRTAAGDGNEKAKMVLQALRQGKQEDVDRLVEDYYSIPQQNMNEVQIQTELQVNPMENPPESVEEPIHAVMEEITENLGSEPVIEDWTDVLDKETDGLFDENEIAQITFSDFLGNKRRDGIRAKKNSEYFKAFNP